MNENKLIKREVVTLVISVLILVTFVAGISYAYFMTIDKGQDNTISIGDLKVSFCEDEECKKNYANFGQVIGTKTVNGESVIESIYPYENDSDALKQTPYIFNIKNTGKLKVNVTIKLTEDKDYIPTNNFEEYVSLTTLYSNHIKIGISKCNNGINTEDVIINTYGNLVDNVILSNEEFDSNESNTYCLWTWLDNETPNEVQNTYFVANLDFKAEYKPDSE